MKRKLYFWAKKYINSNNVKVAVLAVPLTVILVQQIMKQEFDWTEFFDVSILITFLLLAVCDGIVKFIQRKVAENTEDSAKLTDDYDKLLKRYKCADLVTCGETVFPEARLWLRRGKETIEVQDDPDRFYNLPKQIAENSEEILEAHSASTVYNQINIRLDNLEVDRESEKVLLHTSRTQYFDSLLTNRACDYTFSGRKTTIREMYEPGPFMKPLTLSKMSNHLGFNGFVMAADTGRIPFIYRKKNLSIAKNLWATSIGASLKASHALRHEDDFKLLPNGIGLGYAVAGEIRDELRVTEEIPPQTALDSIFAFYRDLVECGKPQFLFCVPLKETTEEMLRESISQRSDKEDVTADGDTVCFFSLEQLKGASFSVDRMVVDGREYKMMPSSVVSVVLLLDYLYGDAWRKAQGEKNDGI